MGGLLRTKPIVLLTALICIFALLAAGAPPVQAAQSWNGKTFGDPVDLGVPTYAISINDAVFGKEDGREVAYMTVSADNAVFNIVDVRDNKLLRSFTLTGVQQSWRHAIAPDGTVYIAGIATGSRGELWSYSPATKSVRKIGEPLPGEKSLWSMTTDEKGNVYGGTFQSGKVFKYDPVAGTFRDYGSMIPGQEYVRSMAYYEGFLYTGIGSVGNVVKLNVETGEKTVISQAVPGIMGLAADKVPFAYDMAVVDGYLMVRFAYDTLNELLFYDLKNQVWLNKKVGSTISGETGIGVFGFNQLTSMNGKLYIIGNRKLAELDMTTFEARSTKISYGSSLRGAEWIEFTDDPKFPGKSLVTVQSSGKITILNVKDELRKDMPPVVKGVPNPLHNLEPGPDGKLYMSGYPGGTGAVYDPKDGKFVNFTLGQSEGMVGLGDYMYYGVYPGAIVYRSKVGTPVPAAEQVFQIGEDQDRPYIMIAADNKLMIGTIPGYGKLGGALTIYDPATGTKKVYRDIVHNQSITGLAYRNGIIYGSTTIYGGLGIPQTETEAKMFVWDVAQEKKLAEFTLDLPELDKPPMITGLTFGPDGLLWGTVDGIVFKMNPDTYQIAGYKDIYPGVNNYGFWRPYHPRWGKDGLLYVDLADIVTVVDPKTMDFVQLSPTGKEIAFFAIAEDANGNENMYYTDTAHLMMIPVTKGEKPVRQIPVRNGGFEEQGANGSIPGWTNPYPEGIPFTVTDAKSRTGTRSLKVVDTARELSGGLQSDKIAAKPGKTYTAGMSVYVNGGQPDDAALLLYFYDKDGKQLDSKSSPFSDKTPNRWSEVNVTGIAPAGTTHLSIMAYSSRWSLIDAYYDDITLTSPDDLEEPSSPGGLKMEMKNAGSGSEPAELAIKAVSVNGLYAVKAVVNYDPAYFQLASAKSDIATDGNGYFTWRDDNGKVTLIATKTGSGAIQEGEVVARLVFQPKGKLGTSEITVSGQSELAANDADQTGTVHTLGQTLTHAYKVGLLEDVDGDGSVTLSDLTAVAKTVGQPLNDGNKHYDLNQDGRIDIADVALIALYMLK
ncbi:cohesin domain-containing protein [Paenibacillus sp. MBLB4367]|uniref:cohesin domain-containing protein n=1 Tax=Paenibacillus sp. MBLB4367 TaxID=3384767 RepID=UPI0039083752